MRLLRYIVPLILLLAITGFPQGKVIVINADMAIHPPGADYINSGIEKQ